MCSLAVSAKCRPAGGCFQSDVRTVLASPPPRPGPPVCCPPWRPLESLWAASPLCAPAWGQTQRVCPPGLAGAWHRRSWAATWRTALCSPEALRTRAEPLCGPGRNAQQLEWAAALRLPEPGGTSQGTERLPRVRPAGGRSSPFGTCGAFRGHAGGRGGWPPSTLGCGPHAACLRPWRPARLLPGVPVPGQPQLSPSDLTGPQRPHLPSREGQGRMASTRRRAGLSALHPSALESPESASVTT